MFASNNKVKTSRTSSLCRGSEVLLYKAPPNSGPRGSFNQRLLVYFMVMIDDLLGGHTFLFRGQSDWGAVFVRATAHEYVTPPRSLVPELDVGW